MQTIPLTNGDYQLRGIFELHGKFTAHTGAQSKTFKTSEGARKWLEKRGIRADGTRFGT